MKDTSGIRLIRLISHERITYAGLGELSALERKEEGDEVVSGH